MTVVPKLRRDFEAARAEWVIPPARLDDDGLAARARHLIELRVELDRAIDGAEAFFGFHGDRWQWAGDTLVVVVAAGAVVALVPGGMVIGAAVSAAAAIGNCGLHFRQRSRNRRHREAVSDLRVMLIEVADELDRVNGEMARRASPR
jgi:hypothetical protein